MGFDRPHKSAALRRGERVRSFAWPEGCQSGKRPPDIPSNPNKAYPNKWRGYPDWLGSGQRKGGWRSFEEARQYARSLGLKSQREWKEYAEEHGLPDDIPLTPDWVYKGKGWSKWRDWLGGGKRLTGWRPFDEARQFVRSLGIKDTPEWRQYARRKPDDIPSNPNTVYKAEWNGWADWWGNGGRQHGH